MNTVRRRDGARHAETDSHRVVDRRFRLAVAARTCRFGAYLRFSVEVRRVLLWGNVHDCTARLTRWAGRFSRATSGGAPGSLTVKSYRRRG